MFIHIYPSNWKSRNQLMNLSKSGVFFSILEMYFTIILINILLWFQIKLGSHADAKDGINRTALREIKLLQELSHENVLGLTDVFGYMSNVSLVFEFVDTDLGM